MAIRVASILSAMLMALVIPAGAGADGDPASDVLLGQSVFYPYSPPVNSAVQRVLNVETAAARRAGLPLKVALIASPIDLGVIPDLFGKPQRYADFLDQEISFQGRQMLLVVMAAGYGVQGLPGPAQQAARRLRPPAGRTSTDLARAAITAVAKLAAASGHPLTGIPGVPSPARSGGGSSTPIVIALGAGLVAALAAVTVLGLRRRRVGAATRDTSPSGGARHAEP